MTSQVDSTMFAGEGGFASSGDLLPVDSPQGYMTDSFNLDYNEYDFWWPWPCGAEADALLDSYRQDLAPLFPFAVVPASSAAELFEDRPLLWKGIMLAACYNDGERQLLMGQDLLDLAKGTSWMKNNSLDLLQGLQLVSCW
jgi:hypothetical protein